MAIIELYVSHELVGTVINEGESVPIEQQLLPDRPRHLSVRLKPEQQLTMMWRRRQPSLENVAGQYNPTPGHPDIPIVLWPGDTLEWQDVNGLINDWTITIGTDLMHPFDSNEEKHPFTSAFDQYNGVSNTMDLISGVARSSAPTNRFFKMSIEGTDSDGKSLLVYDPDVIWHDDF